jgi:hypothetical protein
VTTVVAPTDQANALVNDLGYSVGQMFSPVTRSSLTTPSLSSAFTGETGANKSLVWGLQAENSLNHRYGTCTSFEADTWAPGFWSCQATSFVKKCTVEGYNGANKVYQEDVDLRVYREVVSGPAKNWNNSITGTRVSNPILPYLHSIINAVFGSGSIPTSAQGPADTFYNVLFVGWADYLGYKRFALIDYYPIWTPGEVAFTVAKYQSGIGNMAATPKGTGASGSTALASNFIKNNYYVGGSVAGGYGSSAGQGKIVLPKIRGQESTTFYLTDSSTSSQIKVQSSTIPTRVISTPTIKPAFFKGSDLVRIDDANSSDIQGYLAPGSSYAGTSNRIVYSQFYVVDKNVKKQILLTADSYAELKNLLTNIDGSGSTSSLTKIDGITLIHGTNYIKPNLSFVDGNITTDNWGLSMRANSNGDYFAGHVVDGTSITGTLYNSIEGIIGSATARGDYYYILPGYSRVDTGGGNAKHTEVKQNSGQAATDFRGSELAERGKHAGKFLKSAGFTTGGVTAYRNALESSLKQAASRNLAGKVFNGYFVGYNANLSATANIFQFNLEGFPGIPAIAGMPPFASSSPEFSAPNPDATKAKYMKVINDAKSALDSGKTVTSDSLVSHLSGFLRIGVPLATLKTEVLNGLAEGKIAYLMKSKGITRDAALKEWAKDPLYVAINKFFTTAGSSTYTSSSSGSGGSGSGGSGSGNNNKGKNNKGKKDKKDKKADTKDASSESKTLKITVTRGLSGYRTGIRSTGNTSSRPTLIQTYEGIKSSKQINGTPIRSFEFPFVPSQVVYSGLGINWTEIERTGSYPIVDWTSFQLLKISFSFDIVSMAQQNQAGFGLYYSCEDQITELREMAQSPYPVTFLNMDKFMQDEIRWPSLNTGRGIEFVIQEFSVTAVQRTQASPVALRDSTVPNRISRASCTMTLQEIPVEQVDIVQMPPIKPCKKECDKDKIIKQEDSYRPLFTPTIVTSNG